jgi:DUF1680 family protein
MDNTLTRRQLVTGTCAHDHDDACAPELSRRNFLQAASASAAALAVSAPAFATTTASGPGVDKPALVPQKYVELALGAVRPRGWLLKQLTIMKDGATGHLDETHDVLRDDNGWLGGKGDGGEQTPYWLDGAVPLAFLLDDEALKDKVRRYLGWAIENQRPSGYFGPFTSNEAGKRTENGSPGIDWWPRMPFLKAMQQYHSATGDQRAIDFLTKYFRYQWLNLDQYPLAADQDTTWAQARGNDNLLVVYSLYRITQEPFLLELGEKLYRQSSPWAERFAGRDWVIDAAAQQNDQDWMSRHGVNVAMALKAPAIRYQRSGDEKLLEVLAIGWRDLMTLHGLPNGMFSADEDLHGNDPVQGTELCAIVETMFSLEQAVAITGNQEYMEALERIAYNALPAHTTDDYKLKQYYQMPNQVEVRRGCYDFSFAVEDTFSVFNFDLAGACCLTNMSQGWTKFTSHLWYATPDNGLAVLQYGPSAVTATVGDSIPVTITEETNYPFGGLVALTISLAKAAEFPLELRIPRWCSEAVIRLNGRVAARPKGNQVFRMDREWNNDDHVILEFPMQVTTSNWAKNSRAVERGPLVYALKVGEKWTQKSTPKSEVFAEVLPTTVWNYGIRRALLEDPQRVSRVVELPAKGSFFWNLANVPLELEVPARRIPNWKAPEGVAHQPVTSRDGLYMGEVDEKTESITLVPYGCTKLRIVAFPVVV